MSRRSTFVADSISTRIGYDLKTRLIVVAHGERLVKLIVDSAREFLTVPGEQLQAPAKSGHWQTLLAFHPPQAYSNCEAWPDGRFSYLTVPTLGPVTYPI
jgi:hypothetical protein